MGKQFHTVHIILQPTAHVVLFGMLLDFNNGLIIIYAKTAAGVKSTFPISFTTSCSIIGCPNGSYGSDSIASYDRTLSSTYFTTGYNANPVAYTAIGF